MRTIGLVGGMTPESTVLYYQLLIRGARARSADPDPLRNPVVLIYSLDLSKVAALQRSGRSDELAAHLAEICERLRLAGAEVGALTANTPHLYLEGIRAATRLELVSIVDATCSAVARAGLARPLLLGTRLTMTGPMYPSRLAVDGIEAIVPGEEDARFVDHAIYNELALGIVRREVQQRVLSLCREAISARGADAVILACTELPLVLSAEDLPVPVVDTTRVHADALLDRADEVRG